MIRAARLLLPVLLLCAFAGAPKNEPITILVVRHAEKAVNQGDDPHLSDAGLARAQALARVAENANVGAVYISQFQRTKETAAPLLAKHGDVKVNALPVDLPKTADYPKMLATTILSHEGGKVVLVVSHSNLVPGIVEALTSIKVPPMGDDEFSRLYIITIRPGTAPQLIVAQYGCQ